jgi:hypothetical protein
MYIFMQSGRHIRPFSGRAILRDRFSGRAILRDRPFSGRAILRDRFSGARPPFLRSLQSVTLYYYY